MGLRIKAVAALVLAGLLAPAYGQEYPVRTIRIVVPVAAGGSPDVLARIIGEQMRARMGQAVVVDNRVGAGQMIGADLVAKSAPDGYTIMLPTATFCSSAAIQPKLPFDPVNDLTGVSMVGSGPLVVVLHPSVPVKNIRELIALAKSKPGQLNYGSAGTGSIIHFAAEVFAANTGIDIVHVPFKSAAPAVTAVVSGEVPMMFISLPSVRPQMQNKRLRVIAVTSAKRSSFVPELPTVAEAGVPGYEAGQWWGVLAPAKVPAAIIGRLNTEINAILSAEDMRSRMAGEGAEVQLMTPEAFTGLIRSEIGKYRKVVKERNLRAG
ncbi:MAG: tripartite tricarboxylate transporter substrate binding protein [Burkholderiales bacterium]|jgi:tripartite-type tricarboxylate transporter receptor subunit TctC|nr:tripartite tricarboxylate transporter substrate binding protein [Burkholderiales bacterium]